MEVSRRNVLVTVDRTTDYLLSVLNELRSLPQETEWVEFKHNNAEPDEIGEYLSALANSAALLGKPSAWLVWGLDNSTHEIVGTTFDPACARAGGEELESWLLRLLSPKINFRFNPVLVNGKQVVLLEIGAAFRHPVQFKHTEFIRIGSYKKKLKDFPEKERELWRIFDRTLKDPHKIRLPDQSHIDLLSVPVSLCGSRLMSSTSTLKR